MQNYLPLIRLATLILSYIWAFVSNASINNILNSPISLCFNSIIAGLFWSIGSSFVLGICPHVIKPIVPIMIFCAIVYKSEKLMNTCV